MIKNSRLRSKRKTNNSTEEPNKVLYDIYQKSIKE